MHGKDREQREGGREQRERDTRAAADRRDYEDREAREHQRALREVESAPLVDRKEACAQFHEAMRDRPEIVGERVGWLLDGNYGYGSMRAAERVLALGPRANKVAQLTHLIGALEWRCPARMAISAWKKLTAEQRRALDAAVARAMREHAEGHP